MIHIPSDWYWVVAKDASQLWSSARGQYIPADDATYANWVKTGGIPTYIASEDELRDVLMSAGVSALPKDGVACRRKTRDEIAAEFMKLDPAIRQTLWDALIAEKLIDMAMAEPKRVQAVLEKCGVSYEIETVDG